MPQAGQSSQLSPADADRVRQLRGLAVGSLQEQGRLGDVDDRLQSLVGVSWLTGTNGRPSWVRASSMATAQDEVSDWTSTRSPTSRPSVANSVT
jgi:hypothetical protein